jgi:hypothetical protein
MLIGTYRAEALAHARETGANLVADFPVFANRTG